VHFWSGNIINRSGISKNKQESRREKIAQIPTKYNEDIVIEVGYFGCNSYRGIGSKMIVYEIGPCSSSCKVKLETTRPE
jgi:hypothetical protein